jgi:hypothetical protein
MRIIFFHNGVQVERPGRGRCCGERSSCPQIEDRSTVFRCPASRHVRLRRIAAGSINST